jgi:hypothetical protein
MNQNGADRIGAGQPPPGPPPPGQPPPKPPRQAQQTWADFRDQTPHQLEEPSPYANPQAMSDEIIERDVINTETPVPQNVAKRGALLQKMQQLGQFAAKHPFLTVGFVIALLLVACTSYLGLHALLGHATVSILEAEVAVGGGTVFMTLYNAVYLINLCRRAKLKDDLKARAKINNQNIDQDLKNKQKDLQRLENQIDSIKKDTIRTSIEQEKINREAHEATYKRLKEAEENLRKIEEYKTDMHGLIHKRPEGQEETAEAIRAAIQKIENKITDGAKLLVATALVESEKFPKEIPKEPKESKFDLNTKIIWPSGITSKMKKNQLKVLTLKQKLGKNINALATTLKNNPVSSALLMAGVVMFALSGVALYFYLGGATSLYFFGAIDLMSIVPMAIYGLSLIFEGYNSFTIQSLENKMREDKKRGDEQMRALEEERARLNGIFDQTNKKYADFNKSWGELQKLEVQVLEQEARVQEIIQTIHDVALKSETLVEWVKKTFAAIETQRANRIVEDAIRGATI